MGLQCLYMPNIVMTLMWRSYKLEFIQNEIGCLIYSLLEIYYYYYFFADPIDINFNECNCNQWCCPRFSVVFIDMVVNLHQKNALETYF